MPSGFRTLRRVWLAAEVLACSLLSEPATGAALPLNSSAKTSSFMACPPAVRTSQRSPATCSDSRDGGQGSQGDDHVLPLCFSRPYSSRARDVTVRAAHGR